MFNYRAFLGILSILAIILVGGFFVISDTELKIPQSSNLQEMEEFFEELAIDKGAVHAFDVLRVAEIPANIDVHLLGHVVGDELYRQQGVDGIKSCTNDFRNACSHSVVIGTLLEHGESAIDNIRDACYQAPGGSGAYTMCFHGFGHGVLAYLDYEFPKAISFCKRVGTEEYNNREYTECVGGAVMEMIAGIHDPITWQEAVKKYFKESDPLYPCSADFVPYEAKGICYTYLTPHFIESVGGDLGRPTEEDFEKAFQVCEGIDDTDLKNICYGSFGKEFVVLAQDRDIRNIEDMSNERLDLVYSWCELAGVERGVSACIESAVQSLYWGGENNPDAAIRFCTNIIDEKQHSVCTDVLISAVGFYIDDRGYKEDFCSKLGESYINKCHEKII